MIIKKISIGDGIGNLLEHLITKRIDFWYQGER